MVNAPKLVPAGFRIMLLPIQKIIGMLSITYG